jgi:hypothetical protein
LNDVLARDGLILRYLGHCMLGILLLSRVTEFASPFYRTLGNKSPSLKESDKSGEIDQYAAYLKGLGYNLTDTVLLNLDPDVNVPVIFKDVSSLTSPLLGKINRSALDGPPGKIYSGKEALRLLDTLEKAGSSARVVLHESATEQHQQYFGRLMDILSDGGLVHDFLFLAFYDV